MGPDDQNLFLSFSSYFSHFIFPNFSSVCLCLSLSHFSLLSPLFILFPPFPFSFLPSPFPSLFPFSPPVTCLLFVVPSVVRLTGVAAGLRSAGEEGHRLFPV